MAINYQFDVINPFQAALQGYGAGAQILQQERAAASEQAQMAQRNQLFALQMQEAQARLQTLQDERAKAQKLQEASARAFEAVQEGNISSDLIMQTLAANPEMGKFLQAEKERLNKEQIQNEYNRQIAIATALELGQVPQAQALLNQEADAYEASGETDKAKLSRGLSDQLNTSEGPDVVKSTLYFSAGALIPEQFDKTYANIQAVKKAPFEAQLAELEVEKTQAQISRDRAAANLDNYRRSDEARTGQKVQSSRPFDNGTVLNVMTDGTTVVRNSQGEIVQGDEAARVLDEANQYETGLQQGRSGARQAGTIGQQIAKEAFVSLNKVRANIGNLDRVVDAIDKGAKSGFIDSNLPTWDASTIELRNMRSVLGLDIVGSVTFGALSKEELSLALDTALPKDLSPADLRTWVLNKKAAQEKLANYLSEQVRFLSIPGNTLGDWEQHMINMGKMGKTPSASTAGAAPGARTPVEATPRPRQRPRSEE